MDGITCIISLVRIAKIPQPTETSSVFLNLLSLNGGTFAMLHLNILTFNYHVKTEAYESTERNRLFTADFSSSFFAG